MAGKKKTAKSTNRGRKTPAKKKRSAAETAAREKNYRILGVIILAISLYSAYAFAAATPNIVDKIWGKTILAYLLGHTTTFFAIYGMVVGIMMIAKKWEENQKMMIYIALFLVNLAVLLSISYPGIYSGSLLDAFSPSIYVGTYNSYGGVIGVVLALIFTTIITETGTIILCAVLMIFDFIQAIRSKNPEYISELKEKSSEAFKEKMDSLKEERELAKKRREAEEKRKEEEKELIDQDYDSLFHPSDVGEVDVDTQFINVNDVIDGLDEENADEARADRDALRQIREAAKKRESGITPLRSKKADNSYDLSENPEQKERKDSKTETQTESNSEILSKTQSGSDSDPAASLDSMKAAGEYFTPDPVLLNPGVHKDKDRKADVIKKAKRIEETMKNFGVDAKIVNADVGPSITRFEVQPAPGVKVGKIVNLSDDLALNLATSDIRMEAPIPGKSAVGIEVPNKISDIVSVGEIVNSPAFQRTKAPLPFALGKTLSGQNIIADISKMPHLLIAGATGSGKSVCINTMIISLMYKCTPDELRFIMIDPKMVELSVYNKIPHMLIPVVTDPHKASSALNWGIKEMTDRYQLFKNTGVRNIEGYNKLATQQGNKKLPRVVIVIDELADLMMTSPKEVESSICRIAQLARACGIHLVIATQRPSVDVITGLIKANIPSRIAFSVTSNTDSRTILDQVGAEKLLGKGDMLYFPVGKSKPLRVQGTFVSDSEIKNVVEAVSGGKEPQFDNHIEETISSYQEKIETEETEDDLFPQAAELAFTNGTISTSMVQRKLRVGYARAGRIIDELEAKGIISGPNGSKPRKCLMTREEYHG